jgi:hypothetical protein
VSGPFITATGLRVRYVSGRCAGEARRDRVHDLEHSRALDGSITVR